MAEGWAGSGRNDGADVGVGVGGGCGPGPGPGPRQPRVLAHLLPRGQVPQPEHLHQILDLYARYNSYPLSKQKHNLSYTVCQISLFHYSLHKIRQDFLYIQ